MRIFFALSIVCGCLWSTHAQQITITGHISRQSGDQIHLTGAGHLDIAFPIDSSGRFGLVLSSLPADFYNLTGVGDVYLAPGDSLVIGPQLVFSGRGALENNLLQQSRSLADDFPFLGSAGVVSVTNELPPDTFLYRLNQYHLSAIQILDQSGIAPFKRLAEQALQAYCQNLLLRYYTGYGIDFAAQDRMMALFRRMNQEKGFTFNIDSAQKAIHPRTLTAVQHDLLDSLCFSSLNLDDSVLFVHCQVYRYTLNYVISKNVVIDADKPIATQDYNLLGLAQARRLIRNPYILSAETFAYTRNLLGQSRDQHLKDSVYQAFMQTSPDSVYRSKLEDLYHRNSASSDQKPAPDFRYPDTSGRAITLSSLRGKYVYIDVWATWCGPCRAETPYFKELAETYKNKNIYFVGVSIDKLTDKDKWIASIRESQMAGIQVLADREWESDFVVKFGIQGIPRFILIDPKGVIVSGNSNRPSDEKLKMQLDGLLK